MSKHLILSLCVAAVALSATGSIVDAAAEDSGLDTSVCLPMSEMTSAVFQQGVTSTRRRSGNVPTLQCVGNCPSDAPPLLQAHCTRQGLDDYGKPTWRCTPQFASGDNGRGLKYGLGQIRVECEGCLKSGDSNIVKGSCALKYSVTTGGGSGRRGSRRSSSHHHGGEYDANNGFGGLFSMIFMISLVFIILAACKACRRCGDGNRYPSAGGYATDAYGNVIGQPLGVNGGAGGTVHHHHHGGGGGFGGGGFGTGMFTGFLMGDLMSRQHMGLHHGGHGYDGGYSANDWGGGGDDGGGFDAGGWGGTDSV